MPLALIEKPVPRHIVEIDRSAVLRLVRQQVATYQLDMARMTVVTAAAAGYQATTATMAALAGASKVVALTRESKGYPNAADAAAATLALARAAGVLERIEVLDHLDSRRWGDVDIVAAAPQVVGPISRSIVELLSSRAIISLMAEPWELRPGFVDVESCRDIGIKVVAPNLGHPAVMLFPELARLSCVLLEEAGLEPLGARLAVVSDTPCASFIGRALSEHGATVSVFSHPMHLTESAWDAIVVAMRPSDKPAMNINSLGRISESAPKVLLVQFSGEIDRSAATYFGMRIWPPKKPGRGQLGLPLDVLGPAPTIRKAAAGLKAAELAYRGAGLGGGAIGFVVEDMADPIGS
jgi:hypothetical protein